MEKKKGSGRKPGKRKKKQQYIEYDYEELYNQSIEDWDEYFIEQLIKTGQVKSVYATKEVYAGNQLEIEFYPEFTKKQAEQEKAAAGAKGTE